MGTPVPFILPGFEDDKWYNCHLDCFGVGEGPHTCEDDFIGSVECCKTGLSINTWLNDGCGCKSDPPVWYELCLFTGFSAQRLLHVHGPYDTRGDCGEVEDECGCYTEGVPDAIRVTFLNLIENTNCTRCEDCQTTPNGVAAAINDHTFILDFVSNCEYTVEESEMNLGSVDFWLNYGPPPDPNCIPYNYLSTEPIPSLTIRVKLLPQIGNAPRASVSAECGDMGVPDCPHKDFFICGDHLSGQTITGNPSDNCGHIYDSFVQEIDIICESSLIVSGDILIEPLYE